eukprot:TRINITY_DN2715_c0_g1_i13.p1 TRINITY_DN2715_c0_g1~~TRINITY_DN2715_c0_g1_i13.p1  ORF type:complete len:506 (+),score=117.52 TRINITY_DN2715_c0_g1_i13:63-1580(+)
MQLPRTMLATAQQRISSPRDRSRSVDPTQPFGGVEGRRICGTGQKLFVVVVVGMVAAFLLAGGFFKKSPTGFVLTVQSHEDSFGENPFSAGTSGKLFKAVKVREWTGPRNTARELRAAASRNPPRDVTNAPCECGMRGPWRPGKGAKPQCSRWAVTTTIFPPTDLISQLSGLKGWCTVVAGDKKGPPQDSYSLPNVVFLDAKAQEMLPYSLFPKLKWNHFSRKNIGFVFALAHGAQWVFDCDDDNPLKLDEAGKPLPPPTEYDSAAVGMQVVDKTHPLWNPYPLWNTTQFMWPRGFPLDLIRLADTQRGPASGQTVPASQVAVLQSLADNDPDVDAIYRLTRPLSHYFAPQPSAVALPVGVMAPYNAQACLFRTDALWSLLLPVTVHGRVSDIWRSYFTQRILWWAGLRIAFAAPFVTQYRNAHNYLADFQSEGPLYLQSGEVVRRLISWTPSQGAEDVADAMEELIIDMYEHNIVEVGDIHATQAWIEDLTNIGYKFPTKQKLA